MEPTLVVVAVQLFPKVVKGSIHQHALSIELFLSLYGLVLIDKLRIVWEGLGLVLIR